MKLRTFVGLTGLIITTQSVAIEPQDPSLIFKFGFDEVADSKLVNSSSKDIQATIHGTYTLVDAVKGKGMYFDGSGGYVDVLLDGSYESSFTLSYRIKPDSLNSYNQQVGAGWGKFQLHTNANGGPYAGMIGANV